MTFSFLLTASTGLDKAVGIVLFCGSWRYGSKGQKHTQKQNISSLLFNLNIDEVVQDIVHTGFSGFVFVF